MKKRYKIHFLACCLLMLLLLQETTALAGAKSLTLSLGTDGKGVEVAVYQAAVSGKNGYILAEDFAESGVDINDSDTAQKRQQMSETLQKWIQEKQLTPKSRKKTDAQGQAAFSLEEAVYVFRQVSGSGKMEAFLLYPEDWDNQVSLLVQPKYEPDKPDETKPDETKPDETKPDETKPDETKPDETKPDETKPDETKPDETKPDKPGSEENKPDKPGSDKTKSDGSDEPGTNKPGSGKTESDQTVPADSGTEEVVLDTTLPAAPQAMVQWISSFLPRTGDSSHPAVLIGIFLCSLGGILLCLYKRKKK